MTDDSGTGGEFDGLTMVVTGGNGGIGLALAEAVGSAGASVAIWGRNPTKNTAALAHLEALGIEALAVSCDVSDEEQVTAAMAATVSRFGRVDSLFANAGIGGREVPFVDLPMEEWRSVMAVDLDGVFLTFREGARQMVAQGDGGALVAVSSIVSRFGAPRKAAYGAAKPAVEGLVRSLAVELAGAGIRCNALAPGWTDTDMVAPSGSFGGSAYDRFREATLRRTPVRRWGQPADLHAAARFLADPRATFHTGDVIVVDGGYSIA
ncbi:MAG: SDR family oxidoreductase [Ilumatobacteraceae bacterium]|nr:SDR family oxidoreductase [Ilumatobacteraceae bacterium]